MMRVIFSALSGLVFGLGLALSQMMNPEKVLGFFDLFGTWNPTLAFVMAGALVVTIPGYYLVTKRPAPLLSEVFHIPTRSEIDPQLVIGSAIFGTGWAIVGICPGPAFTGLALFKPESLIFFAAMAGGLMLGNGYTSLKGK